MIRLGLALGVAACPATAAVAQTQAERLVQAPLPELVVGFEREEGGSLIVERIPPGETVEAWSRMATTQRFAGVIARGISLDIWADHFFAGLGSSCPGYRASRPRYFDAGGYPAVEFRADCPRNPATGRPETFLLRAFAGASDLHVVQVAFRHVPTSGEVEWAQAHLATAMLCGRSSPDSRCGPAPDGPDKS